MNDGNRSRARKSHLIPIPNPGLSAEQQDTSAGWVGGRPREPPPPTGHGRAYLLGEVLDDAVLRHLGADGKAALELFLDAAQHLLVLLAGKALHPCGQRETGRWGRGTRDLSLLVVGDLKGRGP